MYGSWNADISGTSVDSGAVVVGERSTVPSWTCCATSRSPPRAPEWWWTTLILPPVSSASLSANCCAARVVPCFAGLTLPITSSFGWAKAGPAEARTSTAQTRSLRAVIADLLVDLREGDDRLEPGACQARSARRGRRGVPREGRHHLGREQLHGPLPELGLVPVMTGHEHGPEVTDLLAQRHELVQHAPGTAGDDQRALDRVHGDVLVGCLEIGLEHEERLAAVGEAVVEEAVVEGQPIVRVGQAVLGFRVRRRDEHAARDAPDVGIRTAADRLAALDVLLPVAAQVATVEEIARDGNPAALAGRLRAVRAGREDGERDGRVRLLKGPWNIAHLELWPDALGQRDLPELPVDLVRRVLRPEREDGVDGLEHHLGAKLGLAHVEHLEVAHQAARPDTHDEAAPAQVVEHGRMGRDRCRMELGQVDHARAETDLPGAGDHGGEEDEGRGDALAPGADVLAHEGLGEPQAIGEDHRLLVFLAEGGVIAGGMVEGHGEHAELDRHETAPFALSLA